MLRFIYVILMNLFRAPYIIPKMRKWADHPEKYSEEERYKLVRHVIYLMKRSGKNQDCSLWRRKSSKRRWICYVSESSG